MVLKFCCVSSIQTDSLLPKLASTSLNNFSVNQDKSTPLFPILYLHNQITV